MFRAEFALPLAQGFVLFRRNRGAFPTLRHLKELNQLLRHHCKGEGEKTVERCLRWNLAEICPEASYGSIVLENGLGWVVVNWCILSSICGSDHSTFLPSEKSRFESPWNASRPNIDRWKSRYHVLVISPRAFEAIKNHRCSKTIGRKRAACSQNGKKSTLSTRKSILARKRIFGNIDRFFLFEMCCGRRFVEAHVDVDICHVHKTFYMSEWSEVSVHTAQWLVVRSVLVWVIPHNNVWTLNVELRYSFI